MEHGFGLDIPQTLEEACDPQRLALVVYDMQAGILAQLPHGDAVTERVVQVLNAARAAAVRTFFMRHMSLPVELAGVFQLRQAMAWQKAASVADVRPWFLRGTPGFELVDEIEPLPSEAVLDKITFSAFEGTPLDIALRDCGITAFAIVGVALEIGIEPTVRHGADLGYIPIVVTDACGAGDHEAGQRSLANLTFMGDAYLTDAETFCRVLGSAPAPTPRP
jgi:nicotinamidase-related amidase